MIISLVKTASELEVYAREFEVSCSNLDQLLRPSFEHYKIEPPPLPAPLPLTAYPLDFQPPEGKLVYVAMYCITFVKCSIFSLTVIRHNASVGRGGCKSNGGNFSRKLQSQ